MALTKPKLSQNIDTDISVFTDPILVLHQGSSLANVDTGFLFNRANGLVSNVAVYWSESANSFVTAFTTSSGAPDANISITTYANLRSGAVTANSLSTINGIFWSGNGNPIAGITYTASASSPAGPSKGDQWYDTVNDILYEYIFDGTSSYWVDIQTSVIAANASTAITDSINANIGAFYTYANTKIGTNTNSNLAVDATTTSISTTTGALVVKGGVGIAGNITVGGNLSVAGGYLVLGKQAVNGPAFRAYIDGSQTITSGSQQKVTFGTETFDTNSNFSSSRFTPTVEGYYQLNATVRISGSSGLGEVMLTIWKNGSEYARGTNENGTEQGASFYSMQVSDLAYANGTGDYFEIYIQQTTGGNRDTTAGTNISYFSGVMVRGA